MRIENKEGGNSMSNKSRHRRLLFMMGLVLFSLLGSIWISSNSGMTVYADSNTDVSSNITSLTTSPESISDGGKTTVRVNFDEHAHKIVSGDTITVNWNNSGTVYGQGYSKNIDLNINGVNVGVLSVATDKAVFTFNL